MPETPSDLGDFKTRAVKSTALLLARGFLLRGLGFVGMVLLAKRLLPEDFGAVALGLTIMATGTLLVDGGLGAALIRREAPPDIGELRALTGLQLAIATAIAAVVTAVGPQYGTAGRVCAVMMWALPLAALQIPGGILLERRLDFGPRIRVEIAESLAFFAWAIPLVYAGAGVMGMASASLVRGLVGAAVMARVSPVGLLVPTLSLQKAKGLLGFGFRFQLVSAVNLARDQGVNVVVAAIGGLATLGLWSVAYRALLVPFLLFEALWRVSYPAMSQLVHSGENPAAALRKALVVGSVGGALILTPLAASAPAVFELVLGREWGAASTVVAPAALGLLVAGPISVTAAGYTYALGHTRLVLLSAVSHTAAWLIVMTPLLGPLGVRAVGVGWLASGLVDAAFFSRVLRRAGVALMPTLLPVWLAGLVGFGVGSTCLALLGSTWPGLLASTTSSLIVLLAVLYGLQPSAVRMTASLAFSVMPSRRRSQRRDA